MLRYGFYLPGMSVCGRLRWCPDFGVAIHGVECSGGVVMVGTWVAAGCAGVDFRRVVDACMSVGVAVSFYCRGWTVGWLLECWIDGCGCRFRGGFFEAFNCFLEVVVRSKKGS